MLPFVRSVETEHPTHPGELRVSAASACNAIRIGRVCPTGTRHSTFIPTCAETICCQPFQPLRATVVREMLDGALCQQVACHRFVGRQIGCVPSLYGHLTADAAGGAAASYAWALQPAGAA